MTDKTIAEAPRKQLDAIELLMQDHREVESLFREFEYLRGKDQDADHVVDAACAELRMNDVLSGLLRPAVLEAVRERDIQRLLDEVEEGQREIRELIARVEGSASDLPARDEQFSLLAARVESQFELAETQVFPRAQKLEGLDLLSVADRMKTRKSELTAAA